MNKKTLKIGIVGLGSVGQGVIKILQDNSELIKKKTNTDIQIIGICAKDKNKKRDIVIHKYKWFDNPKSLAEDKSLDVLIELIGGEDGIALEVVESAISSNKHVITANKALLAKHGNYLFGLAEKNKVTILYEAAVAGAIPIIKTLKESTASNDISALYGILNGTCNYILTSMERDSITFNEALEKAKELGFAEADPTFDIEGYDAAHKLSILASISFSQSIAFNDISIQGIKNISLDDILAAKDYGYKIKLLGIAKKNHNKLTQNVRPCLVPSESQLAKIDWEKNAVVIKGSFFGELTLSGPGAGRLPTASAVFGDIFDIINETNYPSLGTPILNLCENISSDNYNEKARFYLRFLLPDVSGTMASITNIMAKNNISIDDITQRISKKMFKQNLVPITIITSTTDFVSINKAVEDINKNNYSPISPNIIIIED
ncbi:MAG: homoserine dehydrogenase [Alphaproteobacteria bacterium]